MAILFTSDLHLGHKNVIEFCNRNKKTCRMDFENVEQMDTFLINKWNQKVEDDDEVYILGDFSFRSSKDVIDYLKRLNKKQVRNPLPQQGREGLVPSVVRNCYL